MIDVKLNMEINERLRSEYQIATAAFLGEIIKKSKKVLTYRQK